jgi:hypothetical protein
MEMSTHLGQSPQNQVVLELVGGINGGYGIHKLDWVRNLPNGTRENGTGPGGQFRVPTGAVLVITDVDWQYNDTASPPGTMQIFRLFVQSLGAGPGDDGLRVFESAIVLGPLSSGGASIAMTAGFVVSSDARIGVDVFPGPEGPPSGLQHAILRGYVTSADYP